MSDPIIVGGDINTGNPGSMPQSESLQHQNVSEGDRISPAGFSDHSPILTDLVLNHGQQGENDDCGGLTRDPYQLGDKAWESIYAIFDRQQGAVVTQPVAGTFAFSQEEGTKQPGKPRQGEHLTSMTDALMRCLGEQEPRLEQPDQTDTPPAVPLSSFNDALSRLNTPLTPGKSDGNEREAK